MIERVGVCFLLAGLLAEAKYERQGGGFYDLRRSSGFCPPSHSSETFSIEPISSLQVEPVLGHKGKSKWSMNKMICFSLQVEPVLGHKGKSKWSMNKMICL